MGMFDDVRCDYQLPGEQHPALKDSFFQTKDLDCTMTLYVITADGRITEGEGGPDATGNSAMTINFYASNGIGSGPGGLYTQNGEDHVYVRYRTMFVDGRLQCIEQTEFETQPAVKPIRAPYTPPSPGEIAERKKREKETLAGRQLYILMGLQEKPYAAIVVAESERELVFSVPREEEWHDFKIMSRDDRDRLFFDSEADALQHRQDRDDAWTKRGELERAAARKVAP